MNHHFNGNFGGDYVEGNKYSIRPDAPSLNHPNAMECPQCWKGTWRGTQNCIHCEYDIWEHDFQLRKKAFQKRNQIFALLMFTVFSIGLAINNFIDNPPMWLVFLPFIALFGVFIAFKNHESFRG